MSERKAWIDSLKGFLMILVIWSHTCAYLDPPGYYLTAAYMAVYFFLTGYTATNWNSMQSMKKRASRLLIPFFIYGGALLVWHLFTATVQDSINIKEVLLSIGGFLYNAYTFDKEAGGPKFLRCGNNTFWFLTTMFLSSIFAIGLMSVKEKRKKQIYIVSFFIITLLLNCMSRYLLPWGLDTACMGAVLILTGAYYKEKEILFKKNKLVLFVCLFALYIVAATINPGINMAIKEYGAYGLISVILFYIIAVSGSVCYMLIFEKIPVKLKVMKLCAYIGRHSIAFLCIQILTIRYTTILTQKVLSNLYAVGVLCIVSTILIGGILNAILSNIADKYKIARYL